MSLALISSVIEAGMFYVHWILRSQRLLGTVWVIAHPKRALQQCCCKAYVQKGKKHQQPGCWCNLSVVSWYVLSSSIISMTSLRHRCACSCAVFMPPYIFIFLGALTQSVTQQLLTSSFAPPQYEHGWGFLLFYRHLRDREIARSCGLTSLSAEVTCYMWHFLAIRDLTF